MFQSSQCNERNIFSVLIVTLHEILTLRVASVTPYDYIFDTAALTAPELHFHAVSILNAVNQISLHCFLLGLDDDILSGPHIVNHSDLFVAAFANPQSD